MNEITRILFVCVENSNRSQMAEAFVRIHGGNYVNAFSAGSRPRGSINETAILAMNDIGYDLTTHRSKSLEEFEGTEVDIVVTMGCGDSCPSVRAKNRIDWAIPDPRNLPYEEFVKIRDLIEQHVKTLLREGVSMTF